METILVDIPTNFINSKNRSTSNIQSNKDKFHQMSVAIVQMPDFERRSFYQTAERQLKAEKSLDIKLKALSSIDPNYYKHHTHQHGPETIESRLQKGVSVMYTHTFKPIPSEKAKPLLTMLSGKTSPVVSRENKFRSTMQISHKYINVEEEYADGIGGKNFVVKPMFSKSSKNVKPYKSFEASLRSLHRDLSGDGFNHHNEDIKQDATKITPTVLARSAVNPTQALPAVARRGVKTGNSIDRLMEDTQDGSSPNKKAIDKKELKPPTVTSITKHHGLYSPRSSPLPGEGTGNLTAKASLHLTRNEVSPKPIMSRNFSPEKLISLKETSMVNFEMMTGLTESKLFQGPEKKVQAITPFSSSNSKQGSPKVRRGLKSGTIADTTIEHVEAADKSQQETKKEKGENEAADGVIDIRLVEQIRDEGKTENFAHIKEKKVIFEERQSVLLKDTLLGGTAKQSNSEPRKLLFSTKKNSQIMKNMKPDVEARLKAQSELNNIKLQHTIKVQSELLENELYTLSMSLKKRMTPSNPIFSLDVLDENEPYIKFLKQKLKKDLPEEERKKIEFVIIRKRLVKRLNTLKRLKLTPRDIYLNENILGKAPYNNPESKNFIAAAKLGNLDEMKKIISQEGRHIVLTFDHIHATALHWAVRKGHYKVAELCLQCGANVEAKDIIGRTPLYFAIACRNLPAFKLLLENRAQPWSTEDFSYKDLAKNSKAMLFFLNRLRKLDILMKMVAPMARREEIWEREGPTSLFDKTYNFDESHETKKQSAKHAIRIGFGVNFS